MHHHIMAGKQPPGLQPAQHFKIPVLTVGQLTGHALLIGLIQRRQIAQLAVLFLLRVQPLHKVPRAQPGRLELADGLGQLAHKAGTAAGGAVVAQLIAQRPDGARQRHGLPALIDHHPLAPAQAVEHPGGQTRGREHLQAEKALALKGAKHIALGLQGHLIRHQQQGLPSLIV